MGRRWGGGGGGGGLVRLALEKWKLREGIRD